MKSAQLLSGAAALLTAASLAIVAAPAKAQTAEELIVTGRYARAPDNARTLSQAVSYADLDLSTDAGRRELRHRLSLTARYLCEQLGETGTSDAVAPSCRDAALKDAMQRAGTLEAHVAPRGTTWVAGPPWVPPYPPAWVTEYP